MTSILLGDNITYLKVNLQKIDFWHNLRIRCVLFTHKIKRKSILFLLIMFQYLH